MRFHEILNHKDASINFSFLSWQSKKFYFFMVHCKPKPCIAHRELPVSQFPQGKTCFHYREPLFSLQGPCFHYRDFPVNPCTSLLGIAVCLSHSMSSSCGISTKEIWAAFFQQTFRAESKWFWAASPTATVQVNTQNIKPDILSLIFSSWDSLYAKNENYQT